MKSMESSLKADKPLRFADGYTLKSELQTAPKISDYLCSPA